MQMVIDIPQTTYNHVFDNAGISNNDLRNILLGISKSVILPSGHGRLIDADKLEPRDISPESWYSPMWGFELVDIEDAPTIIETDKAGEEE